jgi:hypothetical protein
MNKLMSAKSAGNLLLVILAGLAVFHLLVIAGIAPPGVVWGGRIEGSSNNLAVVETTSLIVTMLFAFIISVKIGYLSLPRLGKVVRISMWIVFGYFTLNIIGNLASSSSTEKLVFTPLSIVLAVLAGRVAIEK